MRSAFEMPGEKRLGMVLPEETVSQCNFDDSDHPPWTSELHGLSQALLSKTRRMKIFWWSVIAVCISCGTATTVLVIFEYMQGPTATSTTIRLVESLELPAITVCPKVPDAFDLVPLLSDIRASLPELSDHQCIDLLRFWIGGSGFENMDLLQTFNETYLNKLNGFYHKWSRGYTYEEFFNRIHSKYGYACNDLFYKCELGDQTLDCCEQLFQMRIVMRRGICYEIRRGINQTVSDDMGRLILSMKAPVSVTSPQYDYIQPQLIVYVTDNYEHVVDFPRFYLYQHEWNRMRFTARFIELLQHPNVCTDKACPPLTIASNYYEAIQLAWSDVAVNEVCVPGCKRWDYMISLQQTRTLWPFENYFFNFEASYTDLQYEYMKEVYTISVPGFMSQIGGQFGFFLGLSIITFIQMILYAIHYCAIRIFKATHYYLSYISKIDRRGVYPAGCAVEPTTPIHMSLPCSSERTISLDSIVQSFSVQSKENENRVKETKASSEEMPARDMSVNIRDSKQEEGGIQKLTNATANNEFCRGNVFSSCTNRLSVPCSTKRKAPVQMEEPLKWYSPGPTVLRQSAKLRAPGKSLSEGQRAKVSARSHHCNTWLDKTTIEVEKKGNSGTIPTISQMIEILTP